MMLVESCFGWALFAGTPNNEQSINERILPRVAVFLIKEKKAGEIHKNIKNKGEGKQAIP